MYGLQQMEGKDQGYWCDINVVIKRCVWTMNVSGVSSPSLSWINVQI